MHPPQRRSAAHRRRLRSICRAALALLLLGALSAPGASASARLAKRHTARCAVARAAAPSARDRASTPATRAARRAAARACRRARARARHELRARARARARKRTVARAHAHLQGAVAGERSAQDAEGAGAEGAEATGAPQESPAAAIAAVLATACANTEITPQPENLALVRAAILCLINRRRAEDGEQPLIANADLEAAAESHAAECVAEDYFAHVSPSGETPVERIRATGYLPSAEAGYVLGENLAWGTFELSTPQAIAQAWFASPPHLANILESQYRETGIGVAPAVPASLGDGNPGATYAQEFGVVLQ